MAEIKLKLTVFQKFIVWIVVEAIKRKKFLWLATVAVQYVSSHLKIDKETKTWTLTSDPMFHPENQVVTFEDWEKIFKSDPSTFKITETKTEDGKFKSYTVEAPGKF